MKSLSIAGILSLAVLCPSCTEPDDAADTVDGAFSQALSSAEEDGVLRFVNDCPTTLAVLDVDAALDVRAATRIVVLRDGADGACGTADDAAFGSMAALDDVPWVGDVALSKLLAHAIALGYVDDQGGELAADYDGVRFSPEEAAGVLAIAHGASLEILDVDLGLDARAARAIVAARPFDAASVAANMEELAAASYVGPAALERLKSHVAPWQACATESATVRGVSFSSLEAHDTLDLLNQAPVGVLETITGIGPVIAGRIDHARPFDTLSQLAAVDGVGPSVAGNLRDQTATRWCPLLGARCGCLAGASYRPPYVAFDENGLYYFLAYGERWEAEREVDAGFLSHDGDRVVLTDVAVPADPDGWQDIAIQVFDRLWDCCLRHQYAGDPLELGPSGKGVLHLGRARNTHDGELYVLAYWQDIDDASFGWLFAKDAGGNWVQAGEVFLN